MKKNWYILSYDIRQDKRLKKFHYRLKKRGLALQRSVFLIEADATELEQIIQWVEQYTHTQQDDVRLYPISHPKAIWSAGSQHHAFNGLHITQSSITDKPSGFIKKMTQLWKAHL